MKAPLSGSLFNKVEKRSKKESFLVNFENFSRQFFYRTPLGNCLWYLGQGIIVYYFLKKPHPKWFKWF